MTATPAGIPQPVFPRRQLDAEGNLPVGSIRVLTGTYAELAARVPKLGQPVRIIELGLLLKAVTGNGTDNVADLPDEITREPDLLQVYADTDSGHVTTAFDISHGRDVHVVLYGTNKNATAQINSPTKAGQIITIKGFAYGGTSKVQIIVPSGTLYLDRLNNTTLIADYDGATMLELSVTATLAPKYFSSKLVALWDAAGGAIVLDEERTVCENTWTQQLVP